MASKKTTEIIAIRPMDIQKVTVRVVGDTPLIMHKWSEKARRQMLESQQGIKKGKAKEVRDPLADFIAATYFATDPQKYPGAAAAAEEAKNAQSIEEFYEICDKGVHFGFPVTAFK